MSETGLKLAQDKVCWHPSAGRRCLHPLLPPLEKGVSGFISEDTIEPLLDPSMLSGAAVNEEDAPAALGRP